MIKNRPKKEVPRDGRMGSNISFSEKRLTSLLEKDMSSSRNATPNAGALGGRGGIEPSHALRVYSSDYLQLPLHHSTGYCETDEMFRYI